MNSIRLSIVGTFLILSATALQAQNFIYQPEDWLIITNPGAVNALAETWDVIYFATDNGIFSFLPGEGGLHYEYGLSKYLDEGRIYHLIFNEYTDFFWAVHENGISFKSSLATYWQHAGYSPAAWVVQDLGYTSEYIWLNVDGQLTALDPFSGHRVEVEDVWAHESSIQWGASRFGQAGRDPFPNGYVYSPDIEGDPYLESRFRQARFTLKFQTSSGEFFAGTSTGDIYYAPNYSHRLELLSSGLGTDAVTVTYLDDYGNYWFGDSEYKREGISFRGERNFLTRWKESDETWEYYHSGEDLAIQSADINCILRHRHTLYLGTMDGLLVLNIPDREWTLVKEGLHDPAIWDLTMDERKLYVATARGINEVALEIPVVLTDNKGRFDAFVNKEVYDLTFSGEHLYVASANGLSRMHWQSSSWELLSDKFIREVEVRDSTILASDGQLWQIVPGQDDIRVHVAPVSNFAFFGDYVWITERDRAVLIQRDSAAQWNYGQQDGIPGRRIYDINCDAEWVWFMTDKGVAFYHWRNYHFFKN